MLHKVSLNFLVNVRLKISRWLHLQKIIYFGKIWKIWAYDGYEDFEEHQKFTIKGFVTFYYPCMVDKVLFRDQIFEIEIFMDFHVLRFSEFENQTLGVGSVSVSSISPKQIILEISNLVFYICIIYRCYLKLFIKIGQRLWVLRHKKGFYALRPTDGILFSVY